MLGSGVIWVSAAGPKPPPQIGRRELSEPEPQSDVGAMLLRWRKPEGQSAIHLREHNPGIEIPLWCKPAIDSGRDPVECPGTLRCSVPSRGRLPGSGAKKDSGYNGNRRPITFQIFGNKRTWPRPT